MKIERNCPICNVAYYAESTRLKFGRQTTCSRACSYILRGKNIQNNVALECATCGKKFNRAVSCVKGKHDSNFCSSACHYLGRSTGKSLRVVTKPYNVTEEGRAGWREGAKKTRKLRIERDNYRHTEATRAKLSKSNALAIAKGRVKTSSRIESVVAAELSAIGIDFTAQFPVRADNGRFAFVFDFLLADGRALEVNGTFWHSDPRFFPEGPIHEIQKRNAIKWANKLAESARLGIEVIQVWEHDINKCASNAVRNALGIAIR